MAQTETEDKVQEDTILSSLIASRYLVETSKGPIWLVFPMTEDKILSKYYYNDFIIKNTNKGILKFEDAMKMHKKHGLWSEDKEKQLVKLPKIIEDTLNEIQIEKQQSKVIKLKEWLRRWEKLYLELLVAKNTIFSNTLEYLANERVVSYMMYRCFFDTNSKRLWPSFDKMTESTDPDYIAELMTYYSSKMSGLDIKTIRSLARCTTWRIRWNISKNNVENLFNRRMCDISHDQFMLIYWSQVYDMAYESLERPPESVIEDDKRFDEWLEENSKKNKVEISQRFYGKGSTNSGKIDNAGEVFSNIAGYYDEEGIYHRYSDEERWRRIDEIRGTNTPGIRKKLANEENRLVNSGGNLIAEEDLRKKGVSHG